MVRYAMECNRCGKVGDWSYSMNYRIKKRRRFFIWCFGLQEELDLCPECYKELCKFITERRDQA